jgi:hypothetical protein
MQWGIRARKKKAQDNIDDCKIYSGQSEFKMEPVSSVFANKTRSRRKPCKSSDQQMALHLRYAKIGIAAVAAAARYQSDPNNSGLSTEVVGTQRRGGATS